ncbi:MAG: hypothetical protein ACR2PL_12060 [Dehalococcoidia bacterium]
MPDAAGFERIALDVAALVPTRVLLPDARPRWMTATSNATPSTTAGVTRLNGFRHARLGLLRVDAL